MDFPEETDKNLFPVSMLFIIEGYTNFLIISVRGLLNIDSDHSDCIKYVSSMKYFMCISLTFWCVFWMKGCCCNSMLEDLQRKKWIHCKAKFQNNGSCINQSLKSDY